jgi:hypothetical protein
MLRLLPLAFLASIGSVLALGACGPSTQLIRTADSSAYDIEYPLLWNAVLATVRAQYPGLAVVDAINGTIITKWKLIENDTSDTMSATGTGESLAIQQETLRPGRYFRLAVNVADGPPWRLDIDGEAMQYKAGMEMITPWDHSDVDEPVWVRARIDHMKVAIYQALQAHARTVAGPSPRARGGIDVSPWQNLGPVAAKVVGELHEAARKKDVDGLRKLMIQDFAWSEGGAPSAATAAAMWRADPLSLAALVHTLEAGCSERAEGLIVCPTRGGGRVGSHRVELKLVDGAWRFAAFYVIEAE